ncbi:DUF4129 domain-containing protein [Frigoribacterium sp. Leaf172]|uniref:DUF4129 domain-containing protein n=1 Tax=Frigoribacterium sp. Leaf172 TaxID=1736285 RepID=UPI0006FAEC2F|nr:hypothetical protein ASF89_10320 [Frigoribacterium sp. Leaf172]
MTMPTAWAATPLTPDPDEARRELIRELTGADYAAARPTWLDRAAQGFWDWIAGIRFGGAEGAPAAALLVALLLVVALVVVVFAVYGRPRLDRRSAAVGRVFGVDDDRDADSLRAAARAAADRGDHSTAVAESFRALTRALVDRGAITTSPGTTANGVGDRAGRVFPDRATELRGVARIFDEVRYLGRPGSDADYRAVAELDRALTVDRSSGGSAGDDAREGVAS